MKKIFMAIAAMTMLIATSCKKENVNAPENLVPGEGEFLVTIANAPRQNAPAAPSDGMTVKTIIDGSDILWQEGDMISINDVEYKTEMDGTSVIFKPNDEGRSAVPDGDGKYKAYYPVDIDEGMFQNEFAYYDYDLKNLPMYAESDNNVLTFHNICAALKITVPVACNKIVISANENLAGKFSIGTDVETGAPMAVLSTDEYLAALMSKEITVNGDFTADAPVYVAIPAGTYTNFAVEFLSDETPVMRRALPNDLNLKVNNLYNLTFGEIPADAFCFTANGNCSLVFKSNDKLQYYDSDNSVWQNLSSSNTINLSDGQKVYIRAKQVQNSLPGVPFKASGDGTLTVSGNIMYLLDPTGCMTDFTSANQNAFISLFANMSNLVDASGLILPATTLAISCYQKMFYNCNALKAAPNLNATTLADNCYYQMFLSCSSLGVTTTQRQGANTLTTPQNTSASNWGYNMFYNTGGEFKGTPSAGTPYYFYDATEQ